MEVAAAVVEEGGAVAVAGIVSGAGETASRLVEMRSVGRRN